MTRDTAARRRRIVALVSERALSTQEELATALTAEGWTVTQSSVSRDIAALGLAKVDGIYRRTATPSPPGRPIHEQHIADGVIGVDTAGDVLIVLHTPPGEANRVGVSLDRLAWPEVAGTIAGDDTIFVAARAPQARTRLLKRLRRLVPVH